MTWIDRIINAHTAVTNDVSHNVRLQSDRYFVWQEEGENWQKADNGHGERSVVGTTDFFTKHEIDPWKEAFEKSLTFNGIAWELNSVQYEEDTGFTHYEWVWEVS